MSDFLFYTLLSIIVIILSVQLVYKFFYKPFKLTVNVFPTSIILTYQYGFKTAQARLYASSDVFKPTITRSFNHLSFVIPINMQYEEVIKWLHKANVDPHYSTQGKDALELLRSVFLYYATVDLEEYHQFQKSCNQMVILRSIRKNRNVLKNFMRNLAPAKTKYAY